MSEQLMWDRGTGTWRPVKFDANNNPYFIEERPPEPPPPPRREGQIEIYGPITDEMATAVESKITSMGPVDKIFALIDSTGGRIRARDRIIKAIRATGAWLVTVNMGQAHSAAGDLFIEGNERYATRESSYMIHNSHVNNDDTPEHAYADTLKSAKKLASNAYSVTFETALEWSCREQYFNASEQIAYGIATDYSAAESRTPVNQFAGKQVEPQYDCPATKDFVNRRAQATEKPSAAIATISTTLPTVSKPTSRNREDEATRQRYREAFARGDFDLPVMPTALKGHVFSRLGDLHDIVEHHNSLVTSGQSDPMTEYHARQSNEFLKTIQRLQNQK